MTRQGVRVRACCFEERVFHAVSPLIESYIEQQNGYVTRINGGKKKGTFPSRRHYAVEKEGSPNCKNNNGIFKVLSGNYDE